MSSSEMVLNWSKTKVNLKVNFKPFDRKVLNEGEKNEALDLIMRALFTTRNDPIINALMFDAVSIKSLKSWIKMHLEQNIAYGCFLNEVVEQGKTNKLAKIKLVAVDVLYVRNMRDTFKPSKDSGEAFGNFITYIKRIEKHLWSMGAQRTCNILTSFGIFISDEFRNYTKISIEMRKNRKKLAQTLRMEILGAAFISLEMQKASENDKYETLHHFTVDDCKELGLGDVAGQEYINLLTVFPIIVMGFRQRLKRAGPTVAELRKQAQPYKKIIKKEE